MKIMYPELNEILKRKIIKYSLLAVSIIGFLLCLLIILPLIQDFIIRIVETMLLHRKLRDLNKWYDYLFGLGYKFTVVFVIAWYFFIKKSFLASLCFLLTVTGIYIYTYKLLVLNFSEQYDLFPFPVIVLLFVIIAHIVVNSLYFDPLTSRLKGIKYFLSENNIFTYIIWTVFGIFLLYSMSNVFMYFDDFGYASLSYGYIEPNVQGQNFTFSQLRHFLWEIYLNWSGRVVFPALKILMLKNIWVYRIVQSVSVLISFIALCRLSSGKRLSATIALFSVTLYGVFHFQMFRNGFYWFSVSATYVLPLAFFFAGCLIMRNLENNIKNRFGHIILGSFSFFMTGISQEQTAFTLTAFITILCVFDYIQFKKIILFRFPFFAASIIGSLFLLLAPGNFRRFRAHDLEAPISLFRKITRNLYLMSRNYLNLTDNMIFILLFSCFICYISYILWKANKLNKFLYLAMFPCSLFFLLLPLFLNRFNILHVGLYASFYIYVLFSLYIILKYLVYIKDRYLAALFWGALFSQITMLFYSPYIVEHMEIIFYFALFALFIHTFADMQATISKEKLLVWVLLPVMLMSSINLAYITRGYSLNKSANIYNDNLLRQVSQEIKAGIKYTEIELMQMPDTRFASDFPVFMQEWMREFYDIPDEVEMHYLP